MITRRTSKDIKSDLLKSLETLADHDLYRVGFTRRHHSLDYIRKKGEAKQKLIFHVAYRPKSMPTAEIHLLPMVVLELPAVINKALELVDNNEALIHRNYSILGQPIEWSLPKDHYADYDAGHWYATGRSEIDSCMIQILAVVKEWVLPWLSDLDGVQALIDAHYRGETRIVMNERYAVYIAASFLLKSQPDNAREIVKKLLSKAALRVRYAAVFKNLGID